jgi:tetratricopeptide (TPR) repeat protein/O-antigen ligase
MTRATSKISAWTEGTESRKNRRSLRDYLLTVVDGGLGCIIFLAPYFFGGRHELGRLVLLALVALISTAWFLRQVLLPVAHWPRTWAHCLILLALATVTVQLIPLPATAISQLSPRTADLLPLWTPASNALATLGTWQTLSLDPHETIKSLAMLVSYSLLFVVVAQRIQERADIYRLLRWIGASAALMAVFGILLFLTGDGRYFWFYKHPYRSASQSLSGAFINRNHFAHFLILGVGPLASWLVSVLRNQSKLPAYNHGQSGYRRMLQPALAGAALVVVLFAILLSSSRGGILTLLLTITVVGAIFAHSGIVNSKNMWSVIALASVVMGLLSLYGYDQVSARLDSLTHLSIDKVDRGAGRRKIWSANLSAITAGGILGSGAGSHRMIYPVYLPESLPYEYSHAESGYLQIATENGVVGAALLVVALCFVAAWLVKCFRRVSVDEERLCLAAIAGGLAASAMHSFVDFVWYIPACMSIAIVLVACVFRLSQLTLDSCAAPALCVLPRARWIELTLATALLGSWTVVVFLGPAVASIYWDRYLHASVSNSELKDQRWSELATIAGDSSSHQRRSLNKFMIEQLSLVTHWDPCFGRAHLRLAAKYITEFELRQLNSPNRMTFPQIRDAAISSSFRSPAELESWLRNAFGSDIDLLYRAQHEAHCAVSLCPLQGEGYLYLADLGFLDCHGREVLNAYVEQGVRVRPHDASVLFEVGKHELAAGKLPEALEHWTRCFKASGPQQMKIVYLLAGRVPASVFLSAFRPDWRTLGQIWIRYRETNMPQDIEAILTYSNQVTKRVAQQKLAILPGVLLRLSNMYADIGRRAEALACLERAYAANPQDYEVRHALADAMSRAGRISEAETHYRWCLSRRPADHSLSEALMTLSKLRFATNDSSAGGSERSALWRSSGSRDSSRQLPAHAARRQP